MKKTARITAGDIAFWILIALVVCIAVWKMVGSPTDTAALISVSLFIIGSEILLWKTLFSIDKKVACGFIKMKYDMDNKFNQINNKLESIDNLIRRKR
ncbi:MAG: hypothetical protein KKB21_02110 [Nanoarchaeota archaeon]|nr:hypothetical protein [Nanoarchaeota archaeon]MBU4086349.1 hypothetical protein [Nanoarchaeota archaeon]